MEDDAQQEVKRPDQVAATKVNLDRLRRAARKAPPTLEELANLRAEVKARSERDEVLIVELDGPTTVWAWLCKRHRETLKAGWFVKQTRSAPHPLVCDKCLREGR